MVERLNRTIKESTIKAYEYDGLEQLQGACPGLLSKLQLRKALECDQMEGTIPGDLRGLVKKIQASLDFIHTISL